jgi:hypothetical protein
VYLGTHYAFFYSKTFITLKKKRKKEKEKGSVLSEATRSINFGMLQKYTYPTTKTILQQQLITCLASFD